MNGSAAAPSVGDTLATRPQNREPLKALFEVALDEDPTKRLAFLRERWVDPSLYAAMERLPAEHEQAGAFLSTPVMDDLPR